MKDGSFLAMYSMGGLAEYCVIPISALAAIPDSIVFDAACIIGGAGLTAFAAGLSFRWPVANGCLPPVAGTVGNVEVLP